MLSAPASHELAIQELEELRRGTEAYAEQVSRDFEELTWLRYLSEQLDACDAASPLGQVAETVLVELRSVIGAEAVVLVGSELGTTPLEPGRIDECRIIALAGCLIVDDAACRRLIEPLQAAAADCPLIRNRIPRESIPSGCTGLHSYMAVPVIRQDALYGWLVALNRNQRAAGLVAGEGIRALLPGEDEFGTEEAGLLHAAARALASHARNAQLFREKELLLIGVMRALINAIDAKDTYTWGHSDRVALMAKRLGEELQLDYLQCERLYTAGLLHDVGKIGIPDSILQKAGPLTDEEFKEIKKHPEIGYAILQHLQQLSYVLPGVLHHHESWDGRGYPHGLQGEKIPLFGRILAVVDTYDAMTSCRPYRTAMPHDVARSKLIAGAGQQWDARIVAAFLDCADDIKRIREAARGQVLHRTNTPKAPLCGTDSTLDPTADEAGMSCDPLQFAMMALNHL
jgi:HD-GYP domain-containing protein (c-di-GMP phosphodiesterase class II)